MKSNWKLDVERPSAVATKDLSQTEVRSGGLRNACAALQCSSPVQRKSRWEIPVHRVSAALVLCALGSAAATFTLRKVTQLIPITVALIALVGIVQAASPRLFGPGVISGPANDAAPAFASDGKTVYFFRSNGSDYDILVSHLNAGRWSKPMIAPFSGRWRDLEPAMAPDGSYMIFASSRPAAHGGKQIDGSWSGQNHPGKGGNLWRVDRKGKSWSEPVRLPDSINRSNAVFSPSIAADGTIYYMEASGEGNKFRLYCAQFRNGRYETPEPLPFTAGHDGGVDPAVAPDQSFLVFSSVRPPAAADQQDLFIAFHKDGEWSEPVHLPDEINRYASIIETHLGSDGHTLYFTSSYVVPAPYPKDAAAAAQGLKEMRDWNNGLGNIWQVDLTPYLRKPN